jgi:SanA protein
MWPHRRILLVTVFFFAVSACAVLFSDLLVLHTSANRTYSDVAKLPHRQVGVLLGCIKGVPGGGENPFFTARVRAAAELFHAGKVDYIVVSGDNHAVSYNETIDMRDALIKAGVPYERIYPDYAGFRTLDSMVRAKEIFGQHEVTVISQKFHNQRAIFIAQHHQLDAIGFNAQDVSLQYSFDTLLREQGARVKTVLDLAFRKKPRFLGPQVRVGIDPPTLPSVVR